MKHNIFSKNKYATVTPSEHDQFKKDVVRGLSAAQKHLDAKYFYDAKGDKLFQQIMESPEYYLTGAEAKILFQQKAAIIDKATQLLPHFDIVELGAGDASKSIHLLKEASAKNVTDAYYPIDISANMIEYLEQSIPQQVEGLYTDGLAGDYFDMLEILQLKNSNPKLILFMGASIGNMPPKEALHFFRQLNRYMSRKDLLLVGFDLKKNPDKILAAYNDKAGITKQFNLNLLERINRELDGNFNTDNFCHYPIYDPGTGACKSYLISKKAQTITIEGGYKFMFEKDEPIYMEVSQKYAGTELQEMAADSGFKIVTDFIDNEHLFVDSLWQKI